MKSRQAKLLIPLLALAFSACAPASSGGGGGGSSSGGGGSSGPLPGEVTTYLVLGPNGLYKGRPGITIEEKSLDNCVEYKAHPGDPLPGKADVTSTVPGVAFETWLSYDGGGVPERCFNVPASDGKILYAFFAASGGGGGSSSEGGGGSSSGGGGETTYEWYIVGAGSFVSGPEWEPAGGVGLVKNPNNDNPRYTEYMCLGLAFAAGDLWKCCDAGKAVWVQTFEQSGGKSAFETGDMKTVSDTYGGLNAQVVRSGLYDLYLKIYPDSTQNKIWAEAHK